MYMRFCRLGIIVLGIITLLFLPLCLYAQTAKPSLAADLDRLLEKEAVSWGEAARFVLAAADWRAGLSEERAFTAAVELAGLPKNTAAAGPANLGGVSLLIMRAFDMKGGLYRVFPTPHYAYRELKYLGLIQGRSDPHMKVSGERFLQILGRVLDYTGADREAGDRHE
jgi:hypothetical protein